MDFVLTGHTYEHAVQTVIQSFYPNEGYKRLKAVPITGMAVESVLRDGLFHANLYRDKAVAARSQTVAAGNGKREMTQALAKAIYMALAEFSGISPPWGTLTGVRPAKIVTERMAKGESPEQAAAYLRDAYLVREDKVRLCMTVAAAENRFLSTVTPDDAGIYIGIPFCPSRCRYCSFASYPLERFGGLRDSYLTALYKELDFLKTASGGRNIRAVYIGGGTPTALEPSMLDDLLSKVAGSFRTVTELTVEAGRPDTVTREKLAVLRSHGVTRLAINPQTLSDETLARVGRNHTAAEFYAAYEMAEAMGFDNINCDVILGLPGENADDVSRTFQGLAGLGPSSVTVHTLALKRAAELNHSIGRYGQEKQAAADIEEMLRVAADGCQGMGLEPYYMYRQKNMVGNHENVGYVRPGQGCVYNHQTMTEAATVLAAGAGAVTKVYNHKDKLIKRCFNVREIGDYINRIDKMIDRKAAILEG